MNDSYELLGTQPYIETVVNYAFVKSISMWKFKLSKGEWVHVSGFKPVSCLLTKESVSGFKNNTVLILTIGWFDKVKIYASNDYNSKLCEIVVFNYFGDGRGLNPDLAYIMHCLYHWAKLTKLRFEYQENWYTISV